MTTTAREAIKRVYNVDVDEDWPEIMEGLAPYRDLANGEDVPPFLLGNPKHRIARDLVITLALTDVETPEDFLAATERIMGADGVDDERTTRLAGGIFDVCEWVSMVTGDVYGRGSEQLLEVLAFLSWLTGRVSAAREVLDHLATIDETGVRAGQYDLGNLVAHALATSTPPPAILHRAVEDLGALNDAHQEMGTVETVEDVLRLLGIDPDDDDV